MEQATQKIGLTCQGKKVLEGVCECSTEWRGTQSENEWEDCQFIPEIECSNCNGTGFIESID